MVVAFNSLEGAGQEAAVNMVAAALAMTIVDRERVLMVESGFGQHMISDAVDKSSGMLIKEPFAYMDGEGMDYLLKKSRYHMLDEKNVIGGIVYVSEHLGYVPAAVRNNRMLYESEFGRECGNILHQLEKRSDYVFVDCTLASEEMKRTIYQKADLVVTNLSQSEDILDEYFSCLPDYKHKAVYCIGNYIREDPCNLKNIQRIYRIEHTRIGVVPYNVEFLSSLQRGRAPHFFREHMLRFHRSRNQSFFREAFRMARVIKEYYDAREGVKCENENQLRTAVNHYGG